MMIQEFTWTGMKEILFRGDLRMKGQRAHYWKGDGFREEQNGVPSGEWARRENKAK